jgi:hypothetical protein
VVVVLADWLPAIVEVIPDIADTEAMSPATIQRIVAFQATLVTCYCCDVWWVPAFSGSRFSALRCVGVTKSPLIKSLSPVVVNDTPSFDGATALI